ncbi:hypothetical protein BH09SUM1_BH09SUM1_17030 [soil metagenome]
MILQRYVLRELIAPILLSVVFFTFVMLLGKLFDMAEELLIAHVELSVFLQLIGIVSVSLIILTAPMAALLGSLIGVGRITAENELLAMRVAGVSLGRVFWPMIFSAVVASSALMWVGFDTIPNLIKRLTDRQTEMEFRVITHLEAGQNHDIPAPGDSDIFLYFDKAVPKQAGDPEYTLRMEGVAMRVVGDTKELTGAAVERKKKRNTAISMAAQETVFFAKEGIITGDLPTKTVTLQLSDGTILPQNTLVIDADKKTALYRSNPERMVRLSFEKMEKKLDIRGEADHVERIDPRQYTMAELRAITRQEPVEKMWQNKDMTKLDDKWTAYLNARNEFYRRFSLPFSLLAFVLIAIPLAVELKPRAKIVSFLIALCLILIYYVLLTWAGAIGMTNSRFALPMFMLPNVAIGGAGIILFWRSQR